MCDLLNVEAKSLLWPFSSLGSNLVCSQFPFLVTSFSCPHFLLRYAIRSAFLLCVALQHSWTGGGIFGKAPASSDFPENTGQQDRQWPKEPIRMFQIALSCGETYLFLWLCCMLHMFTFKGQLTHRPLSPTVCLGLSSCVRRMEATLCQLHWKHLTMTQLCCSTPIWTMPKPSLLWWVHPPSSSSSSVCHKNLI